MLIAPFFLYFSVLSLFLSFHFDFFYFFVFQLLLNATIFENDLKKLGAHAHDFYIQILA